MAIPQKRRDVTGKGGVTIQKGKLLSKSWHVDDNEKLITWLCAEDVAIQNREADIR